MNYRHNQIIDFIRDNQNCTSIDIALGLNISNQTALKYLRELKMLRDDLEVRSEEPSKKGRPFETYVIKS